MSLAFVDKKDRLAVSLAYLSAVRNCIARGDLPAGQPLYPDDAIEFLDEILNAKSVIEKQAAQIQQLQSELKELNSKISRDKFEDKIRSSRIVSEPAPLPTIPETNRLGQLSTTLVSYSTHTGEHNGATNEEDVFQGSAGNREPSHLQESGSTPSSIGESTQGSIPEKLPRRKKRDAIPEPIWDDL